MTATDPAPADLARWIAETIGRPVTALEELVGGYSRRTYSATAGDRAVIARVDVAEGPFAGTEISLRREALVYEALSKTRLPVPALLGARSDGGALLFELAPGVPQLFQLSPEAHESVVMDYLDRLAELHRLDPEQIGLQPLVRVQAVHRELARWESVLDIRATRPWLVARLAFALLRRHVPQGDAPAVLCHGDAGPNNFLHDGTSVTALLDWEFWHLGDPADDLAWWVFRAHLRGHGGGDLAAQLARWQASAGRVLSAGEMLYYTTLVLTRTLVTVAAGLDQGVRGIDETVFLALVPVLGVQILRGLAALEQLPVDLPQEPVAAPGADLGNEAIALYTRNHVDDATADPGSLRLARTSEHYLGHLGAVARFGNSVLASEQDDAAALLGMGRAGPEQVDAYLGRAIAAGTEYDRIIPLLLNRSYRRAWLWPATLAQARATPIDYADVLQGSAVPAS